MTAGQRRRLELLVEDYRRAGIPEAKIAEAAHRLAQTFKPPADLEAVDQVLRDLP